MIILLIIILLFIYSSLKVSSNISRLEEKEARKQNVK